MKLLKKILALLIPLVTLTQFAFATPMPALFYASSFEVNVGDTLTFDLKVNPTAPVYTVGATLKYDPKVLSFSGASVGKAWLPISRSPYEMNDISTGKIVRTAGYPEGVKTITPFTHYVFKATAPGDTKVVISEGMALDSDNNDSGVQVKTIAIRINDAKTKIIDTGDKTTTPVPVVSAKKLEPQTIIMEVTGSNATYADVAYPFSVMHKLKAEQETVGSTTYSVFNRDGAEVYKGSQDFNIASDTNLIFEIPANSIAPGDYSIVLTSRYSNQKVTTNTKKDIGVLARADNVVEKKVEVAMVPWYVYVVVSLLVLIIILMMTYNRSKAFRKFIKNF